MSIPTNLEILKLLDRLDVSCADEMESQWLDFKPWISPKEDMKMAFEYAVCFANAEGGVIVFGVSDGKKGRAAAIHGAKGYNLDSWRKGIYAAVSPNLTVEVEELGVPEGTGKLLIVRVPKGASPPYGTAQGLFKKRVGKNCMPLDPANLLREKVRTGAVDWSGQPADGMQIDLLDPLEIARARAILRSNNPESELLKMQNIPFLEGIEAIRKGKVTNAGLLLFGRPEVLVDFCPQNQIHYVHQLSETKIARNDLMRGGLLGLLERIEQIFSGPANPEEELSIGLFKLRIPAFPLEVVREVILNAVTHRDYSDPGEILLRHTKNELVVTSPGGFVGGITLENILRHEPVARNRTLANAFVKLRLVESAGTGRRRIFVPLLGYGKRMPKYESDGEHVTLRIFDGSFDKRMASLVAKWKKEGRECDLDGLLVLTYLKQNAYLDTGSASRMLQLSRDEARSVLDLLAQPRIGILERKGGPRSATFHLAKGTAKDLLGKAAYTKTKGLNPARYAEMVKQFIADHGSITPKECRELLGVGDSPVARVEVSRYFRKWIAPPEGFLRREGNPPKTRYFPTDKR